MPLRLVGMFGGRMASAFSHVIVAAAIGRALPKKELGWREMALGACCSVVPDLDVIGFHVGIPYEGLWGHRGLTHSLFFAALLSGALAALWSRWQPTDARTTLAGYLFLCTASHGVLDAMTDGGLGVAFFSPFDPGRYWLPFRPVIVAPIEIEKFFTPYGAQVMISEILWIWLPACAALAAIRFVQRFRPAASAPIIRD